ncbi:thiamine biosynthesis lipoprotein [Dyadobacter koreensis]|uniref:FAD:protein FMN transferase n=1 Tax=Dyadobacter koreensis TaxID=408657 RepID=A0A1H6ZUT1_9BACT|nr:FAD:protein FMN transferase [Dyadobacter koreensis]SEJ56416.1 thiamine biosynthesis lipoprotein [Dyadobacter koreensis]
MDEFRLVEKLMGSAFELIIRDTEKAGAEALLKEGRDEIKRLENLLTEFDKSSFTSLINENAGVKSVQVDEEVYQLIARCIGLSNLTQGAFDISVGPLKKLYNFKNEQFVFPEKNAIRKTLSSVGFKNILLLPDNHIFLKKKGMYISFAAIGKGYAADKVKKLWIEKSVSHGVINASGDLTVIGKKIDDRPWQIGIANPDDAQDVLCFLPIENASIATSGDYEQFFMWSGTRYAHTLDPRTGKPVTGIKSVTVVGPGAELCDALATAVFVMGVNVGLHFINQLPQTHCLIINDKNEVFHSRNLNFKYAEK